MQEWLPPVIAAESPAKLCIAYLISPLCREALTPDGPDTAAVYYTTFSHGESYELAMFADEGVAVRWLLGHHE